MVSEKVEKEGPRSFTRFLEQVADGELHDAASRELYRLANALLVQSRAQDKKIKGSMTLTIEFTVEKGFIETGYDIKLREPKPRRSGSVFFFTRGGNLSVDRQEQRKLPLQEVRAPEPAREVAEDRQPAVEA
jgi:hypothetical protein